MQPLFRTDAIQASTTDSQAKAVLSSGRTINLLMLIIVLLVTLIVILGFRVYYPRLVTADGVIKSDQGIVTLYIDKPVFIRELLVKNDASVFKGQVLARVSLSGETSRLNLARRETIRHQLTLVEGNISESEQQHKSLITQFRQQQTALNDELQSLAMSIEIQSQMVEIQQTQLNKMQQLTHNGTATHSQLATTRTQLLSARQNLLHYQLEHKQRQRQLIALERDLSSADINFTQRRNQWLDQVESLNFEFQQLSEQHEFDLLAPMSGYVTNLQIQTGQNWQSRKPYLQILPQTSTMHVELMVPSRQIGLLKDHMAVALKLDAYPYQQYGVVTGQIIERARASLAIHEMNTDYLINEPMYRIKVQMRQQFLQSDDKQLPFVQGMRVSADIHLESRTIAEWLFEPLRGLQI